MIAPRAELKSLRPLPDDNLFDEEVVYQTVGFPTIAGDKPGLHVAIRILPAVAPLLAKSKIPVQHMDAVGKVLVAAVQAVENFSDGTWDLEDAEAGWELIQAIRDVSKVVRD